ncbi:MAG: sugar transferase [Lachnospiraceae bacterium]|nr:sugar transferase [Lachnospiraceae bacterium]
MKNVKKLLYEVVKRLFDIGSSFLAILISSPLWLLIAVGIKLSSKGPVLYRADRVGKAGKPFVLFKFRSMHVYQPNKENQHEQREGGYIANKDRIFPFGNILRKSKLDELPQLINILLGQMSVIGPRPITEAGVKKHYIGKYDSVLSVKPGLSCLDSLYDYAHGELIVKNNEEFDVKIAPIRDYLANMYVEKQSVSLDIYCIIRTIKLIFEIAILGKRDFQYTAYEREADRAVFGINR